MADQRFFIDLDGDVRVAIDAGDPGDAWLEQIVRSKPGSTRVRMRFDDDADTEGHAAVGTRIRIIVDADDDAQGHAMALHFPSVDEAAAFRKRLLASGVLVGTVAIGALTGAGLSNLAGGDPADGTGAALGAGAALSLTSDPIEGSAWTQDERLELADDEIVFKGGGRPPVLQ